MPEAVPAPCGVLASRRAPFGVRAVRGAAWARPSRRWAYRRLRGRGIGPVARRSGVRPSRLIRCRGEGCVPTPAPVDGAAVSRQGRFEKAHEGQQTGATIAHGTNTPDEEEEVRPKLWAALAAITTCLGIGGAPLPVRPRRLRLSLADGLRRKTLRRTCRKCHTGRTLGRRRAIHRQPGTATALRKEQRPLRPAERARLPDPPAVRIRSVDDDATVGNPTAGQSPRKRRTPQVQRLAVERRAQVLPRGKEPDQGTEGSKGAETTREILA